MSLDRTACLVPGHVRESLELALGMSWLVESASFAICCRSQRHRREAGVVGTGKALTTQSSSPSEPTPASSPLENAKSDSVLSIVTAKGAHDDPTWACVLCGEGTAAPYAKFATFTWVRCRCGLIFKVSASSVLHHTKTRRRGEGYYRRRYYHRMRTAARQLRDIMEHIGQPAQGATNAMLDIGCSRGYTLAAAQSFGLKATGLDHSAEAVDACRRRGFHAELGDMISLPFEPGSFSIVTMKNVLEHSARPTLVLQEVRRVLRSTGVVFIAVPNAEYWRAVANPVASRFYRPDTSGGSEHQVCYTADTISALLYKEGFRVLQVHPSLIHRKRAALARAMEYVSYPWRIVLARLFTSLRLRKEVWIIASC